MLMTREADTPAEFLLADFLALDAPEGYRAELIDGEIVVTPPPDGTHGSNISRLLAQFYRNSSAALEFSPETGVIVPSQENPEGNRLIPDGVFASARELRSASSWMSPDAIEMVLEVTSSRGDLDRNEKRLAYAAAGIPLYLLIDRKFRKVVLFSDPRDGDYLGKSEVHFGLKLDLPAPFGFTLDTAPFAD
jgi:Uma2 family endonuclease